MAVETATTDVPATSLRNGQVLVGDAGGHSQIYGARPNSLIQGFITVETEHGHLLLDDDPEVTFTVLAE